MSTSEKIPVSDELFLDAVKASYQAGLAIMEVYEGPIEVENKEDNSPLTIADQRSNDIIEEVLERSGIPVLSEEGKSIPHEERSQWDVLWIVDPLDGTKEFIKRNGEFTVNIALVKGHHPIAGIIYVPAKDEMYIGRVDKGSWKIDDYSKVADANSMDELINGAHHLPQEKDTDEYVIVASRSHPSQETKEFIDQLEKEKGNISTTSIGSSLKICLVAEGKADIYPRFAPTMEWDTAAGHAILRSVGKDLIDHETGESMAYNRPNLRNNWFIAK